MRQSGPDKVAVLDRLESIRWPLGFAGGTLAVVLLFACGPSTRKLDEAPIYDGAGFRLKLVRYFEDLPLHYTGEVFRVQCSSAQTRNSSAHKTQDAGWVSLGGGDAIGSKSAADACGSFRGWYPTALPEDLIVPAEKPEYCKPQGNVDCRHFDFSGEREPHFENVQVNPAGHISFLVHSRALRHGESVRVESRDFGKTWEIQPADPRPSRSRHTSTSLPMVAT